MKAINGELWLSSRDGFFRFNPSTKLLTHYLNDPENINSLSDNLSLSNYT